MSEDLVREALVQAMRASGVPDSLHGGLARYVLDQILPGGFLQAVLANDLEQATRRGDPFNRRMLGEIVDFLVTYVSPDIWGSRAKVLRWTRTPDRFELGCPTDVPTFTCPICGRVSFNPNDIRERYCGYCHKFVDDAQEPPPIDLLRTQVEALEHLRTLPSTGQRDVADEQLQEPQAKQQDDDHPDDHLDRRR